MKCLGVRYRIALLALGATLSIVARAADFICNEGPESSIACVLDLVERTPDPGIVPTYKSVERYVLKGTEKKLLPDTYIGREYCFSYGPAFYDHPGLTPDQVAQFALPPTDNPCITKPGIVAASNTFGGPLKQVDPFMPLNFPQDRITRCDLISKNLKNRPYDYVKDDLAIWAVTGKGVWFPGEGYISNEEHDFVVRICKDKWFMGLSSEKIQDFDPPTVMGFEKAKASNGQELRKQLDYQRLLKDGRKVSIGGHVHWYLFYQETFLEVHITNDNGESVPADDLRLVYRDGGRIGTNQCGKNSYCSYSNKYYATSAITKSDLCGKAIARFGDQYIMVETSHCP